MEAFLRARSLRPPARPLPCAVSASIVANGNLIAAAATATPGDNQNARNITNLQRTSLAGGTTNPVDTWGALVYRVGTDAQTAMNERAGRDEIVKQLQTPATRSRRVLDEEAANMMKFQRAYEANAATSARGHVAECVDADAGGVMRVVFSAQFRQAADEINPDGRRSGGRPATGVLGAAHHEPSDDPAGASAAHHRSRHARRAGRLHADGRYDNLASNHGRLDAFRYHQQNHGRADGCGQRARVGAEPESARRGSRQPQESATRSSAMSTQFHGAYLFSGSLATTSPYTKGGGGTVRSYQGNATTMSVDVGQGRPLQMTFDGSSIAKGSDPSDAFSVLSSLVTAVKAGDAAGMSQGLDALGRALDRTTLAQSKVGASLNALDDARLRLSAQRARHQSSARRRRMPTWRPRSRRCRRPTPYRAALGAFSRVGSVSLMDYLR